MGQRLKVGLVGCGKISEAHLAGFRKVSHCFVHGVFDVNRDGAEKRARSFGVEKVFDSVDALISECDIVDVCTPPQTHAEIALKALAAGRHLVIEKPLVINSEDWVAIRSAAKSAGVAIAVIHNLKFSPCVQLAKRWVDRGRIGRVIRLQRQFLTDPAADRMLVGTGHWSHSLPGGRWFETLPHELYLTHWFLGPLPLAGVIAQRTSGAPPGVRADEVQITFKGPHALATVEFSASCRLNRRSLTLYGTEGIITLDLLSEFAAITRRRDSKAMRGIGRLPLEAAGTVLRWLPDRIGYFGRRLQGDSPHARIIREFDVHMQGKGPAPTPLDEVDYVVTNCELVGREIDRQAAAL